jgi:hypothetical protein
MPATMIGTVLVTRLAAWPQASDAPTMRSTLRASSFGGDAFVTFDLAFGGASLEHEVPSLDISQPAHGVHEGGGIPVGRVVSHHVGNRRIGKDETDPIGLAAGCAFPATGEAPAHRPAMNVRRITDPRRTLPLKTSRLYRALKA